MTTAAAGQLAGEVAAVEAAWIAFAKHASSCPGVCAAIARRCRRPGLRSDGINAWWDSCCDEGKESFATWRTAVDVLRGAYLDSTRPRLVTA